MKLVASNILKFVVLSGNHCLRSLFSVPQIILNVYQPYIDGIVYPLLPTGSFSEVITTLNQVLALMAVANGV
jgi:hypothetical protein